MKNISGILNIVLLIAVVVLYILHFTDNSDSKSTTEKKEVTVADITSGSYPTIAYIQGDSLMKKYVFYDEIRELLEQKRQQSEGNLAAKQTAFQRKASEFQEKVSKHLVTRKQAEEMQAQLAREEQSLYKLRDQLQMQMMQDEQEMTKQLYDSISSYLKHYNKDFNFSYIISNSGDILYADTMLNITDVIIEGLNDRYTGDNMKPEKDEEDANKKNNESKDK